MIEIRIHGRGGQGNVVAAYLLAGAAFNDGRYCQAFPAFGAERRGAPVVAYVRISDQPILRRNTVKSPAFLIIQDQNLLKDPKLTSGLIPGGGVLVNTNRAAEDISQEYGVDMMVLPATRMATEVMGRPVPNVPLLAAFLSLTGMLSLEGLDHALAERFKGAVLEKNRQLVQQAAAAVPAGLWKESSLVASA